MKNLGCNFDLESLLGIHLFKPLVLFFEFLESCHY